MFQYCYFLFLKTVFVVSMFWFRKREKNVARFSISYLNSTIQEILLASSSSGFPLIVFPDHHVSCRYMRCEGKTSFFALIRSRRRHRATRVGTYVEKIKPCSCDQTIASRELRITCINKINKIQLPRIKMDYSSFLLL